MVLLNKKKVKIYFNRCITVSNKNCCISNLNNFLIQQDFLQILTNVLQIFFYIANKKIMQGQCIVL